MFEKVNPSHPDKIADRIAGAIVDLAYKKEKDPRIAVEVLIGHGHCHIIAESSVKITKREASNIVHRITNKSGIKVDFQLVSQDRHLAKNQEYGLRCGDNGIFKGMPVTDEQAELANIALHIHHAYYSDGKYILNGRNLTICQSYAKEDDAALRCFTDGYYTTINPLGYWTGGIDVDTGATNRKLGSDMGDSVTGGGLHGKDLSKADVSVNIYAWIKAQETQKLVELSCAIGDDTIDGKPYSEIVEIARAFIKKRGGFEKFAEWGLI